MTGSNRVDRVLSFVFHAIKLRVYKSVSENVSNTFPKVLSGKSTRYHLEDLFYVQATGGLLCHPQLACLSTNSVYGLERILIINKKYSE